MQQALPHLVGHADQQACRSGHTLRPGGNRGGEGGALIRKANLAAKPPAEAGGNFLDGLVNRSRQNTFAGRLQTIAAQGHDDRGDGQQVVYVLSLHPEKQVFPPAGGTSSMRAIFRKKQGSAHRRSPTNPWGPYYLISEAG